MTQPPWRNRLREAVPFRPHQIELVGDQQSGSVNKRGENLLRGTVQRASYLGDAVDCPSAYILLAESEE